MTKMVYDLAVKVDEYQGQDEMKAKWLNVGAVMQRDDGGKFILLDRSFSPAGIVNPQNRTNVLLSMFPPKDRQTGGYQSEYTRSQRPPSAPFDDDIPF